jgi:hypothetical protein
MGGQGLGWAFWIGIVLVVLMIALCVLYYAS